MTLEIAALAGWIFVRMQLAVRDPRPFIHRVFELGLIGIALAGGAVIASKSGSTRAISATPAIFIVGSYLVDISRRAFRKLDTAVEAPRRILLALFRPWAMLVLLGTIVLSMPVATQSGVPDYRHNRLSHILDNFHAATSAACLVGITIPSFCEDYTLFGQAVLIAISQCAGLIFAAGGLAIVRPFLWRAIRLRTVLAAAVLLQLAAIAMMFPAWRPEDAATIWGRIGTGLVYATSAIWNTGLSLRADGVAGYVGDFRVAISVTSLAIIGSLGLPILLDLLLPQPKLERDEEVKSAAILRLRKLPEFEAIAATILLGLGAILLWYFELPQSRVSAWAPPQPMQTADDRVPLGDARQGQRWPLALLVSATLRSAGLQSVPISQGFISWPTFGLMLALMTIGGSAGGVGGGLRTTLLTLPLVARKLRGGYHEPDEAVGRLRRQLLRDCALFFSLMIIANILLAAAVGAVSNGSAYEAMMESTAAFHGVGLSTGLTLHLTPIGRLLMIGVYAAGRFVPIFFWLRLSGAIRKTMEGLPAISA